MGDNLLIISKITKNELNKTRKFAIIADEISREKIYTINAYLSDRYVGIYSIKNQEIMSLFKSRIKEYEANLNTIKKSMAEFEDAVSKGDPIERWPVRDMRR